MYFEGQVTHMTNTTQVPDEPPPPPLELAEHPPPDHAGS